MHIAILWPGNFPHGMAAENRYAAFAKGLLKHGEHVVVFCQVPASRDQAPVDLSTSGVYSGITYIFTGGQLFIAESRLRRVLQRFRGFVGGIRELRNHRRRNQLDAVLFTRIPSWQMVVLLLFGQVYGVKMVHERSEHPFLGAKGKLFRKLEMHFYFRVLVRFCDGVVVISRPMEKLFRAQMGRRARLLILPAIVDLARFERSDDSRGQPINGQYIAWCGSIWGPKDGVRQLVEAFIRIADAHRTVKLVLIAPVDQSPDFRLVQQMIGDNGLCDRIVFTGKVSQEEIPSYLGNALVLALARPSSLQAEYGFPTKLPEYLATGRPVLVTSVGDVPRYLKDGENAYLVNPDDTVGFADKLGYILEHPDEAQKVGEKGRMLAKAEFSHYMQAGRLAAFFRELQ